MATRATERVIEHVRRIVLYGNDSTLPDGDLLGRFVLARDEEAFAAIVRRHGPMVFSVCRRILRHEQDAEDAFQATFLVLARKAAGVLPRKMLGNWLYGVAHQTAVRVKSANVKRGQREQLSPTVPECARADHEPHDDERHVLDQELSRLPHKYRAPVVLCDLEGKTRKEAARHLGWPEGTVATRLAKAHSLLASRLTRRGVALAGGALAWQSSLPLASAKVPTSLIAATSKAALAGPSATGVVSSKVAALAAGVLQTMLLTKLKSMTLAALMLGLVALGSGRLLISPAPAAPLGQRPIATAVLAENRALAPAPKLVDLTKPFVQWANTKEFVKNAPHNPLVVNDKVIVGTDQGELRAYQCRDGVPVWTHEHGQRLFHRPCSDGERVFFSSAAGLTAVTAKGGLKLWFSESADYNGPALVLSDKGMVYVGGSDGNLYAMETKTAQSLWRADFLSDAPADPPNFQRERALLGRTKARPTALVSDGETLFLSVFDQCRIVAIDATTGARIWSYQTQGWNYGAAVATAKHVFVGSQDKHFYCLDKKTGEFVWKFETKSRIESGGAVDDKSVYFGSCDGNVYCLNQADGKEQWRFATDSYDKDKSPIYSTPIIRQSGVCLASGEGQAYLINRTNGGLIWKIRPTVESDLFCSPATDGRLIFVTSREKFDNRGEPTLIAIGLK